MTKQITVSWSHTEDFTHTFTVEDDNFDHEDRDALEELIADLDQEQLTAAFDGMPSRTIWDTTLLTEEEA